MSRISQILMMVVVMMIALAIAIPAFSDNTDGADFTNDLGWGNGIRDYAVGHGHEYTDANTQRAKRFQVGVGVDVIVQERTGRQNNLTPLRTTVEGKWDIANKNGGVYVVATYRLSEIWKGVVDLVN